MCHQTSYHLIVRAAHKAYAAYSMQAKQNESKYTGTSNNDLKDGGFGSKMSGDSGFGAKSSSFGEQHLLAFTPVCCACQSMETSCTPLTCREHLYPHVCWHYAPEMFAVHNAASMELSLQLVSADPKPPAHYDSQLTPKALTCLGSCNSGAVSCSLRLARILCTRMLVALLAWLGPKLNVSHSSHKLLCMLAAFPCQHSCTTISCHNAYTSSIPLDMVHCNLQLPFMQTVNSQICTHVVAGGSSGGSALSKLPSTKASNKYDDFDLPERTNGSTKADTGAGFAGQLACLPAYAPC